MQRPENGLILFSGSRGGHRGSFEDFVQRLWGGTVKRAGLQVNHREPALFLMIEDSSLGYVASAVLRQLLGRRTVGLLFRPGPALDGSSPRLRLKRNLLKLLKKMPRVTTLSIIPFSMRPDFAAVADGWIHDLQLWDMEDTDFKVIDALRSDQGCSDADAAAFYGTILEAAAGRPVLVALGLQSRDKGFVRLAAAARDLTAQGWQIVVAGRIDPTLAAQKAELEKLGALVVDRFVSDGEILGAYAAASAVWCCYDPAYDQASGILGRAVQLGCPVVVRAGSLSEALCQQEARPFLAVDGAVDAPLTLSALPAGDAEGGRRAAKRFRERSLAVLSDALQLAVRRDATTRIDAQDG
ncbi:hypothetical protein [Paenirhodobacter sp. CAU 1674]|uniref:hypothetical protein n=1 Tax=Paenirhodobacter sp. CAU 1674 TaxID=3032596 RepID=UPI0023DCA9B3|nr:hypothetical protein [Paenirhodobacter sp. CAU 1674]MDF2142049.1 hypothetical protein [Paenirhodobacter sp. CAU 1674]